MAFTYSGDPANNEADYIRFMIGDTNSNSPILQDAEINYIVSTSTGETTAHRLSVAFRAAATALGAKPAKRSLGPQSEDTTKRLEYYMSMAEKYEKFGSYSGTPPLPVYAADKVFDKNMMGNTV